MPEGFRGSRTQARVIGIAQCSGVEFAQERRPRVAACVSGKEVGTRPGQLGWGYVVAGSSLGARFLLREARSLGYAPGAGADFLSGHAGGDAWPAFLRELDAAALSDTDHLRLCAAATEAFGHAESALRCAKEALA